MYVTAVVWLTVGVPEITPFVMDSPAGRVGWIAHVATAPPVLLATMFVIGEARVNTWLEIAPKLATGSLIVIVKVSLSEPPELFAYRVYVTAVVWLTVGVPEITPFVMDSPAGSVG